MRMMVESTELMAMIAKKKIREKKRGRAAAAASEIAEGGQSRAM